MSETTEKAPSGLQAYQQRKKQESDLKKGLREQQKEINAEQEVSSVLPVNVEELDFGVDPNKTYFFETVEKSATARHQILGNTSKIFDSKTNRVREIKYINIADTIFTDEMGKRYEGYPDAPLSFHNNQLAVDGKDIRLIEFLLSHDLYDGNKHRISKVPPLFTLVNKADLEEKREKEYTEKAKAMNAINENDFKDILPVARIVFQIMDTDPKTVKNKLRDKVEQGRYKQILDNLDSPKIKRSHVLQMGFDQGLIAIDKERRSLMWGESNTFIREMNAYIDERAVLSEVADFSFTTEGNKVYDLIKARLKS